jgi:hypothetical protein
MSRIDQTSLGVSRPCGACDPQHASLGVVASLTLTILFALMLWIPMVGMLFDWNVETHVIERRERATPPAWGQDSISAYPGKFVDYFNDHFAFREVMIYAYSFAKVKCFNVSSSDRVLLGKEHWLFYTGGQLIEDHQGLTPPSQQELKQWAEVLEGRRAWLAERGIRHLFVLVPNKVTIYPEYLPPGVHRRQEVTRADTLTDYLREHADLAFLDLRPVLAGAKLKGLAYYPYGTHWNSHGSYAAYRRVMATLGEWYPEKQPFHLEDFERGESAGEYICHMLGLRDEDWYPSVVDTLKLREPYASPVPVEVPPLCRTTAGPPMAFENTEAQHKLLLVHDSFFAGFVQLLLAEHFQRSVAVRINLELDYERLLALVELENPDVVIEERVERLLRLPPRTHPEFSQARERWLRDNPRHE